MKFFSSKNDGRMLKLCNEMAVQFRRLMLDMSGQGFSNPSNIDFLSKKKNQQTWTQWLQNVRPRVSTLYTHIQNFIVNIL